jgi:hypothetical protein
MKALQWFQRASVLALAAIALPANADQELRVSMAQTPNVKPTFLGEIRMTCYDGVTDDLLTAGLGKTGRRQDRGMRAHRLRRRRKRQEERHAPGPSSEHFRFALFVHHHSAFLGLARRLRRDWRLG